MALKTLRCCRDSSSPEQRSALRAINTLNPPQNYTRKLGGLSPIHSMCRCRAQGLMWGARGPYPPAAAMVVGVVTPDVFCAKATEKRNKNTKISWWLPKCKFITICYKTYCNSYIANSTDNWVSPWLSRYSFSPYGPTGSMRFDVQGGTFTTTRSTCYVSKYYGLGRR
jgi:hypothetical protein